MDQKKESNVRRDYCIRRSIVEGRVNSAELVADCFCTLGAKSGAKTLAVSGVVVYLAKSYSATFRSRLGVSGKTALVTMPVLFMFFLTSELEMGACTAENKAPGN